MNFVSSLLIISIALSCLLVGVLPKGGRGGGGRGSSGGRGRGSSSSSRGSSGRSGGYSSGSRGSGRSYSGRIGSGRSSSIVSSLAGAYVGYKAGRIYTRVTQGHYSTYSHGRHYYYGSRYYNQPTSDQYDTCIYNIEPNDKYFDLTYNDTGARVTEVIYQCRAANETCCDGLDCCSRSWSLTTFIIIALAIIVGTVLLVYMLQKRQKRKEQAMAGITRQYPSTTTSYAYQNASSGSYPAPIVSNAYPAYCSRPEEASNLMPAYSAAPAATCHQSMPTYRPAFGETTNNFVPNYQLVSNGSMPAPPTTSQEDNPPPYGFVVKNA